MNQDASVTFEWKSESVVSSINQKEIYPHQHKMEVRNYPKYLKNPLVRHLAFWTFIITFFTLPDLIGDIQNTGWQILLNICYTPLDMFAVYITLYVLLPGILNQKRILINGLLYLVVILFVAVISKILEDHVFTFFPQNLIEYNSTITEYFRSMLTINMIVGVAVGIKLVLLWYDSQLKSKELISRQVETELSQLRAQLNPHFLFNTLNNIDTLVLHDPEKASEALIQLSNILRYSIYETSSDYVPLDKELDYLENYIQLQKIRINQNDFVEVSRSGSSSGLMIAPLLMIPLVENAFKYSYRHGPVPGIRIKTEINDHELVFITENSVITESQATAEKPGGIGVQNVKRRLELQYPGKHRFEQSLRNGIYYTRLQMDLK